MKKVLVTGAGGFIGRYLTKALVEKGYAVRVLCFSDASAKAFVGEGFDVFRGDITRPETLKGVAKDIAYVFHLAARVADWGAYADFYDVTVAGTRNLMEACKGEGMERFVYFSSFMALGLNRVTAGLDEDAPAVRTGIPYSDTKLDAETLVKELSAAWAIPFTIVRPANVIGPESLWTKDVLDAFHKSPVPLIGGGRASGAFVAVENLVDGVLLAAFSPLAVGRTYHFMDDDSPSWAVYMRTLSGWIGKSPAIHLPTNFCWKLGIVSDRLATLLGKRPLISRATVAIMGWDHSISTKRAREELGWQSRVSYCEALGRIQAWVTSRYRPPTQRD